MTKINTLRLFISVLLSLSCPLFLLFTANTYAKPLMDSEDNNPSVSSKNTRDSHKTISTKNRADLDNQNDLQVIKWKGVSQKAERRKALKKLEQKLKINLFQTNGFQRKTHIYFNAAKQELVSKYERGNSYFELKVSEEKSQLRFRYTF